MHAYGDSENGEDLGLVLSRRLFHMLEKDWSKGDTKFKYKSDILGKLIQSHFALNPGTRFYSAVDGGVVGDG